MLVVPHQFTGAAVAALWPSLGWAGLVFLLSGFGLFGVAILRSARWVELLIHLLAGAAWLLLAYSFALAANWTGALAWGVFGLGIAIAPLVEVEAHHPGFHSELLSVVAGVAATLQGLVILLLPSLFANPVYESVQGRLPWLGGAFLVGGIALLLVQHRQAQSPTRYWVGHLLAGGSFLAFAVTVSLYQQAWTGVALYGVMGLSIALLPWLGPRLRGIDPRSLETRIALTLVAATSLPLILAAAVVGQFIAPGSEGTVGREVDELRDFIFLVLMASVGLALVIGVYAARWLAAPLNALTQVADRLASGDVTAPLPRGKYTEIATLSHAFGEMRSRLVARSEEREGLLEQLQGANQRLGLSEAQARDLAERAGRQSAELRAVINAIAEGIVVYSPAGDIQRMNPAAEEILGYTAAQRRRPLRERLAVLHAESAEGTPLGDEETAPQKALIGEVVRGEITVLHTPDRRTVWVSASAAPILGESGEILGAVLSLSDITRIQELQQQRTQHVLGMSHGLRTPLTAIYGHAQLLMRALQKSGADGQPRFSAEAILVGAQRMGALLKDLVDLAELESDQPLHLNRSPVQINQFMQQLMERLGGYLSMDRVRLDVPKALPPVMADPDRLERIMMNLLGNAFRYSTPDTPVVVSVAERDGELITSVTDHGPGIPPKRMESLFQPQARSLAAGEPQATLGLGLYITKGLVEAHGGRIWAESSKDKGTTFAFSLPVVRAAAPA